MCFYHVFQVIVRCLGKASIPREFSPSLKMDFTLKTALTVLNGKTGSDFSEKACFPSFIFN